MEVQLYVYDLSRGLARQMSLQFLGVQIDAVYHTSLVFGHVEYFFGAGVQTCNPGSTHHGRPMEIISLGTTSLPVDLILEYLESLKEIYTPESYDLFAHNCNNFTNDFAMFLVGKGIPGHITSLPQTVLDTPFGAMLRPQIDRAMRPVVQAPVQPLPILSDTILRNQRPHPSDTNIHKPGLVHHVTSQQQLEIFLHEARLSCAVIFFTSASCAPCRLVYPVYNELALEMGAKAILIRVDISQLPDVAATYSVSATPAFMTFSRGTKQDGWSGANTEQLRTKVRRLVLMAFPPHPHELLKLPLFQRISVRPVTYVKIPPLAKLLAKLGDTGNARAVGEAVAFIKARNKHGAQDAPLPDLVEFGSFITSSLQNLPLEHLFAAYDLLRLLLVDQRVSGFFTQPANIAVLVALIGHVNLIKVCPYNLRLVTIHACCNLSTTPLLGDYALSNPSFSEALVSLIASSILLAEHESVRAAAVSLAYNVCTIEHQLRIKQYESAIPISGLPLSAQVELVASLLEALAMETHVQDIVRGMSVALARLIYYAPMDGEVLDTCRAMDAPKIMKEKESLVKDEDRKLMKEIGTVLLGRAIAG